jgi:hypothetical protein
MAKNYAEGTTDIEQLLLGENYTKKNRTILSGQNIKVGMLLGEVIVKTGIVEIGTNTGNGTVTGFALSAVGKPKIGDYSLVCIQTKTTGQGAVNAKFKLTDPDGIRISEIEMTATPKTIIIAGITFIITEGNVVFTLNDSFILPVEEGSKKLKQVVSSSVDGSQYPKYIAHQDFDASEGDLSDVEVIAFGEINIEKLVFAGLETIETIVDGKTYYEHLKNLGILALESTVLSTVDNA